MCLFGPVLVVATLPIVYVIDHNIYAINISQYPKKEENSLMAQMMPDTSFGPIFIIATLPIVYVVDYNYICYKHQLASQKKKRRKLTYGPNDDRHVVWARFCNCHPSCHVHHRLKYIYAINISQYPKKKEEKRKKTHLWPKRCQTCPGTIFLITALPIVYIIDYNYICYKH